MYQIAKVGKIGKINAQANRKLRKLYESQMDSLRCEVLRSKCTGNMFLGFAHRHKRIWYRSRPELLASMNQTVIACTNCHMELEADKELTAQVFMKLRGEEIL